MLTSKTALLAALLALACFAAASDDDLLGADKCTWGPSYWCSSLQAASECKSMAYCVSKGLLKPVTGSQPQPLFKPVAHVDPARKRREVDFDGIELGDLPPAN